MTAARSNSRVSELAGILDPSIAFAFDLECNEILTEWELKRDEQRFEMLTTGAVAGALGGKAEVPEPKAERW